MADSPVGKLENEILQFLQENKSTEYSTLVKAFVDRYGNKEVALKHPAGATIVICGLSATSYRDKKKTVEGLNSFYLPDEVEMQVVGEVKLTPCSWMMLLLVTCKDRRLYAYDDETEELHMVAQDLEWLLHKGLEYPASLTYYKGQAFEKMTHEDWDKVKKSDFGKSLEKEHYELVTEKKGQMLESLGYKASRTSKEWEIQKLQEEVQNLTEEIRYQGFSADTTELEQGIINLEKTVEEYTEHTEHLSKKSKVNEQIRHSMREVRHLTEEMKHLNMRLKYSGRFAEDSSDGSDNFHILASLTGQTVCTCSQCSHLFTERSTAAEDEATTSSRPKTKQPKTKRKLLCFKVKVRRTKMEQEIEEQVELLTEYFEHLKRQLEYEQQRRSTPFFPPRHLSLIQDLLDA